MTPTPDPEFYTHPTCRIAWVNTQGEPTPDDRPAIGHVALPARKVQVHGRTLALDATEPFPICAVHAQALKEPGMEAWTFEPLPSVAKACRCLMALRFKACPVHGSDLGAI